MFSLDLIRTHRMTESNPGRTPFIVTDAIIEYAVERMAYCVFKSVLKREISVILYGAVSEDKPTIPCKLIEQSAYEKIRRLAKEIMHTRATIGSAQARLESVGFYEQTIGNSDLPYAHRIKARENLDKIHQVIVPESMPISGTLNHKHTIGLDALGLQLEQKKAILKHLRDQKEEEEESNAR